MRLVATLAAVLALAMPAAAHHGWGSYNAETPMTIEGVIDAVTLQNPHGEMTVAHEGAAWLITLAPLSRMNARGASAEIVQQGKTVKAYGYPKRDGTPEIRAEWIEIDGQHFELR